MTRGPAILLDLDGTLVDASDAIVDGVLLISAELGLAVPERAWARGRIGHDPVQTWVLLGAGDPGAALDAFARRVLPGLPAAARVLPGVPAALAELTAMGAQLAVATTRMTASARETLAVTGLDAWIGPVCGRDLVAAPKPAPDVLLAALAALGARPEQAVMIGDTDADVLAARAAGMPCWGVAADDEAERALRAAGAVLILSGGVAGAPSALRALRDTPRGS